MKEAAACLRVLVALAKADGVITPQERDALDTALEQLPGGSGLRPYLDDKVEFDSLLAEIQSPHARDQLWQAAYSMVHCDGSASAMEQQLLTKIRVAFNVNDTEESATRRMVDEAKDTLLPSNIEAIADPKRRQKEIDQDVLKYSVLSAILGAFPVPGLAIATDLAIVALQVKLVRDIGQYWGHTIDKDAAKSLLGGLGLGTGARIAVANLAKLVPVWGSAFGATTAFATTWALGKIANRYFEHGKKADVKQLKRELKDLQKEGREAYDTEKQRIEAKQAQASKALGELNAARKNGTISQSEYEQRVAALAD